MRICRIRVQSVTHFGDEAGLCLVLILTFFPQLALGAEKVLHWPFEQSFTDASPSNNRGEFTEGKHPRFVNGRFGSAIRLEPGELVTCKNGTNIPTAKGESWTINLWARLLKGGQPRPCGGS